MSGKTLAEMSFSDLKQLAKSKNLKFTFKTKTELIAFLEKHGVQPDTESDESMDYTEFASGPVAESSASRKIRIHGERCDSDDLKRLKATLARLYSTNKLTELERVQKYVFTQLGII